jgi:hypothetical protein
MLESVTIPAAGPSDDEHRAARARKDARLRLQLDRLAFGTPGGKHRHVAMPELLAGDTPEQEERDRAVIEAWTRADYARRGLDYDAEMARYARNRVEEEPDAELHRMLDALAARTRGQAEIDGQEEQ